VTHQNFISRVSLASATVKLSFGTFNKYEFDSHGGEGVNVYVIDTGIHINHAEFGDRASWGKTIPQNDVDEDGNGHGTHCAGTIASGKYGVAKAANVIAVKVLGSNGSGSMSDVIAGVVFAAEDAIEKAKDSLPPRSRPQGRQSTRVRSLTCL
jgi:cerevisin